MCKNVICLCTRYVCVCLFVCVCVCVCVWRGRVSITLRLIYSEELFSDRADEAVLPQLNASLWVKTF